MKTTSSLVAPKRMRRRIKMDAAVKGKVEMLFKL